MRAVVEDGEVVVGSPVFDGLPECCLGLKGAPAEAVGVDVPANYGKVCQFDPGRLEALLVGVLACCPLRRWRIDVINVQVEGFGQVRGY